MVGWLVDGARHGSTSTKLIIAQVILELKRTMSRRTSGASSSGTSSSTNQGQRRCDANCAEHGDLHCDADKDHDRKVDVDDAAGVDGVRNLASSPQSVTDAHLVGANGQDVALGFVCRDLDAIHVENAEWDLDATYVENAELARMPQLRHLGDAQGPDVVPTCIRPTTKSHAQSARLPKKRKTIYASKSWNGSAGANESANESANERANKRADGSAKGNGSKCSAGQSEGRGTSTFRTFLSNALRPKIGTIGKNGLSHADVLYKRLLSAKCIAPKMDKI